MLMILPQLSNIVHTVHLLVLMEKMPNAPFLLMIPNLSHKTVTNKSKPSSVASSSTPEPSITQSLSP
jgi:hypothetical protein